jgi:hypothetical protein
MSTSTIAYPPKRLRVSSGSNSSSPLNVKPKFSLDSVKDSAIVKRVISPSSGPRLRKTKSRRSIRTRKSKLDMLDNRHLTSFPLEPPKIGGAATLSPYASWRTIYHKMSSQLRRRRTQQEKNHTACSGPVWAVSRN